MIKRSERGWLSVFFNSRQPSFILYLIFLVLPHAGYSGDLMKLSPQDYIDIRLLIDIYPSILDTCTNSGYDYADMYTEDGSFGVSSEWGSEGKIWFTGRERLAEAAGGGKDGCRKRSGRYHHLTVSPVIKPTSYGASSRSTLLMITDGVDGNPSKIQWQGGYESTLIKTEKGWRFKSRLHVWPGYDWPDTASEMAKRLKKERASD